MIISAEKLKKLAPTTKTDDYIEFHLDAIESIIRAYTNNPFHTISQLNSLIIQSLPVILEMT